MMLLDEVRLQRYLDYAIRDFNNAVGIIPMGVVLHESCGYYAYLWRLGQDAKYNFTPRERYYEWIKVYHAKHMARNEVYLLLYLNQHRVHTLKYVIENERITRESELLDGYRMPSYRVNETLEEYKIAWR